MFVLCVLSLCSVFCVLLGANMADNARHTQEVPRNVGHKCRALSSVRRSGEPKVQNVRCTPSDGRKRIGREMIRINTRWHNRVKNVRHGALLGAKQKKNGKRGKIIKEILIVYNLERNTKEMKMKK